MKACAPGKVVLSGAYAVLSGAPAIVSAVDRLVVADAEREPELVTPEVAAALAARQHAAASAPWFDASGQHERAPWFDASSLRENGQKLGLGSSAAILVASLAALELSHTSSLTDAELAQRVFAPALSAHRQAQAGGSGIDVAASVFGGTFIFTIQNPATPERVDFPRGALPEIWNAGTPASTAAFLAADSAFGQADPAAFAELLAEQTHAAVCVAQAFRQDHLRAAIRGLQRQRHALGGLGAAAGVPIVTPGLATLALLAEADGAALLPAGAGGGDIAFFLGESAPSAALRAAASAAGYTRLELALGAPGVQRVKPSTL